ncbi:PEPxxWA-CTERM sorting domain-containing protein [Phenylobacterium sp.]|uniref:PEPxxWA-CTERM sorting domain-containing protein n=1 Tax=Phenylobacterium sp. TaxID=1871053 RepID=UPI0025D0E65C|nr:PEPxxWA-CTERM sorting domain-containing protein [Phenylobacterium sp.]MBX3483201.1 PEPxxWA-CTERM sorting domain-containing protein [Phenylobacterium sp.]
MKRSNGAARPLELTAAAIALAAGLVAAPALAADVSGSAAIFTNRGCPAGSGSCIVVDENGAGSFTGDRLQASQFYGGYGSTFSASSTLLEGASTSASLAFGSDYLPTMKLSSQSGAETRTGSSAVAFRSFTYTGDVAIDFAIQGALHFLTSGDIDGPFPANEFAGDGILNVSLALVTVKAVTDEFPPTSDAIDIISSTFGFPSCGGSGVLGVTSFFSGGVGAGEYNQSLGLSQGCDGNAIRLNPGDTFAIVIGMQAISNRGGFIDASHTFSVQYDEANTFFAGTQQSVGQGFLSRNIANGAAAPEPATWALMIGGFGLAGGALRRRRPVAA